MLYHKTTNRRTGKKYCEIKLINQHNIRILFHAFALLMTKGKYRRKCGIRTIMTVWQMYTLGANHVVNVKINKKCRTAHIPRLLLSKRGLDKRLINKYREPVIKKLIL